MNYSLIHTQSFSLQARNVSPSKFQALSSFKSCSQFHQKRFGSTGFIKGIYHVPSEREEEEELKHSSSSSYYQRKRRKITSKIEVGKEILLDPKSFRKKIRNQDEDEEEEEPFNFDSIVESKIRQAMQNGEFENLPYTGKTLPGTFDLNDSLDRSERVVIKLLKNNNALPEWVELNKEIKLNTKFAIEKLTVAYRNYLNPDATTSSVPTITSNKNEKSLLKEIKSWFSLDLVPKVRKLTQFEKEHLWNQSKEEFNQTIKKINNQIQHYNVFVPVSFQKYFLIVEDEIADVMEKVERELQNK